MLAHMNPADSLSLPASLTPLFERAPVRSAEDFWLLEREVYETSALYGDRIIAREIARVHIDRAFVEWAMQKARDKSSCPLVNKGWRETSILLLGGSRIVVKTPYFREDRHGRPGPKRSKRGKNGSGMYPVLEALGISDGVSPATRSEIALHVVQASSYREAADMLARRGLVCEDSTLSRIANATARADISLRDAALETAMSIAVSENGPLAGKRVRVSLDGGRARVKINHRGRRTKKGYHRYSTPWREPRVLVIETLDEHGRADRLKLPLYDGLIGDADAVFSLLIGYLRLLGAAHSSVVELVCDGADWIWERADRLVTEAQIPREKLVEAVDFYHVSQYLCETLVMISTLCDKERQALYHRLLHDLRHHKQGVSLLIMELEKLARLHPKSGLEKRIAFFKRHAHRMRYALLDRMKLSVGSGCVESAIRRTINLRFKAPGSFWNEGTVSGLIHLRAQFKAGRWDQLMVRTLTGRFDAISFDRIQANKRSLSRAGNPMLIRCADDYHREEVVHI